MLIKVPFEMKKRGGKREIKVAKEDAKADWRAQKPLLVSLALAQAWQAALDCGDFANMNGLAQHLGVDFSYLSRILSLTLLDPFIVEVIVNGQEPSGTSLARLQKNLPLNWDEQRKKYDFEERKPVGNDADETANPSMSEVNEPAPAPPTRRARPASGPKAGLKRGQHSIGSSMSLFDQ